MQLKNNFSHYIKSLFASIQPYCSRCGSNNMCSVHHIYGRKSNSMMNGITLCYDCHRFADNYNVLGGVNGKKIRQELLLITMRKFYSDCWWEDYLPKIEAERNKVFFEMIKDDIVEIKKSML